MDLFPENIPAVPKENKQGLQKLEVPDILTEAAWQHRFPGTGSKIVAARRTGQPALVVALAEKASLRLHKKFRNLQLRGKSPQVMITAVSRELSGFIWAAMNLAA